MTSIASSPSSLATDYVAVESPSNTIPAAGRFPQPQPIPHHSRFFFEDGNATFIVNDLMYRVHRSVLCPHSAKFDALLDMQTPLTHNVHEVFLKDVTTKEFDAFLSLFYPSNFMTRDNETLEDWTGVLRLADKWAFPSIRQLAIKEVGAIAGPVDKLALGHEYDVDKWLVPSYTALCERREPLTLDEALRLGMEDVVFVTRIRESLRPVASMPAQLAIRTLVERGLGLQGFQSPYPVGSEAAALAPTRGVTVAGMTPAGLNENQVLSVETPPATFEHSRTLPALTAAETQQVASSAFGVFGGPSSATPTAPSDLVPPDEEPAANGLSLNGKDQDGETEKKDEDDWWGSTTKKGKKKSGYCKCSVMKACR
ncbi:hypothetical protein OF83DRAFT_1084502 [Amylostereum chailletii]|nr:hypothetical protein OF83DRAFT_1084502 [Amylostereum chailletii]